MLTDTKVTFQELYKHVAPQGELTLDKFLMKHHHPSCEFENDGHWTFEALNTSKLPAGAAQIVREAEEEGVLVEWIVAHEIDHKPVTLPEWHLTDDDQEAIAKGLIIGTGVVVGVVALPVILAAGVLALGLSGCLSGDPVLIGHWVDKKGKDRWTSCYKWYDG